MIKTTMNPFGEILLEDDNLYCLADGKKIPDEVKDEMMRIFDFGNKWKDELLHECLKDPTRLTTEKKKGENICQCCC